MFAYFIVVIIIVIQEIVMTQVFLPANTRTRILDLMKDKKITQAELAKTAGISESSLCRYLQGKTKRLHDGCIIKIAKRFNVSTDFLLAETDIPDRKNYDIEELGLSIKAARLLYTKEVDPETLNQLLEHPLFPQLLQLLRRYRDETMIIGINSMNEILTFSRSVLIGHAKEHPEDKAAAMDVASDLSGLRTPAVTADTNTLQTLFLKIVKDIKQTRPSQAKAQRAATADSLDLFRQELQKGNRAVDLKNTTEEDIISAILHMIAGAGVPEEALGELKAALLKVFTAMKVPSNDE